MLRRKLKLPAASAKEIVEFVSEEASQFGESRPPTAKVGRADARILGEALARRADVFVTGNAALLKLRMVEDM